MPFLKFDPTKEFFPGNARTTYRNIIPQAAMIIITYIIYNSKMISEYPLGKSTKLPKIPKLQSLNRGIFKDLDIFINMRKWPATSYQGKYTFIVDEKRDFVPDESSGIYIFVTKEMLEDASSLASMVDTIEHELVHYLDIYIRKYRVGPEYKSRKAYMNDPLEINAYFNSLVGELIFNKDELVKSLDSWETFRKRVYDKFIDMANFNELTKVNQQLVENKLHSLYEDLYHEYKAGRLTRLIALIKGRRYKFVAKVESSFINRLVEGEI